MTKRLVLRIKNTFKNQDTDFEPKAEAENKLWLIIKTRWVLVLFLILYGIFTIGVFFERYQSLDKVIDLVFRPAIILFGVVIYNAFCNLAIHRHFKYSMHKTNVFIKIQLIVDALIVTLLVYSTGGIVSWFWTLYILLFIEYNELIPNKKEAFLMGAVAICLFSAVVIGQYFNFIGYVRMPYMSASLHKEPAYFILRWLWVCLLTTAAALASSYLHRKGKLAIIDTVTNLYSRRFFDHMIYGEFERAKRFKRSLSLLMIDIDDFKEYNDTYGHVEGDKILRMVGSVIANNIRRSSDEPTYDIDIACRYGGEELAIILPETGFVKNNKQRKLKIESQINGALILAEKIRKQIEGSDRVTVSMGVATYPSHCKDCNSLVKFADEALYRAKALGKNMVVVYPSTSSRLIGVKNTNDNKIRTLTRLDY